MCARRLAFSPSRFSAWPRDRARPVMRSVVRHSVLFCAHGEQPPGCGSQRIFLICARGEGVSEGVPSMGGWTQCLMHQTAALGGSHAPCTCRRPGRYGWRSPSCARSRSATAGHRSRRAGRGGSALRAGSRGRPRRRRRRPRGASQAWCRRPGGGKAANALDGTCRLEAHLTATYEAA
jgi:hypothetical protein